MSNPKQHNHPKSSNPSDKIYKPKRNEYTDSTQDSTALNKTKNQSEASYHRNSAQDNLENSQNNHKQSRARQNQSQQEDMSNHQEDFQNRTRRAHNNNDKQQRRAKGQQEHYTKKSEAQYEEDYPQENRSENGYGKKNQKGTKRQDKDSYEESHVVYYVKKTQNNEQQGVGEEQKERRRRSNRSQKNIKEKDSLSEQTQKEVPSTKAEGSGSKEEKETNTLQTKVSEIITQLHLNQTVRNEGIRLPESGVKSTSWLRNEQDKVSQAVPKPVIEISAPSDTQSTAGNAQSAQEDKDTTSMCSDTESSISRQAMSIPQYPQPQIVSPVMNYTQMPASAEQQRAMFATGYPQLPMFHAPYIVFPQPNGTSFIQPLYQMPGMNMIPRRSEEEQARPGQQPIYLVPSSMVPTMPAQENQQNNEAKQNVERIPAQFFAGYPMNPQFIPYAQMHPGFMTNTMMTPQVFANTTTTTATTTTTVEKERQKNNNDDSQSREDNASDRRDD